MPLRPHRLRAMPFGRCHSVPAAPHRTGTGRRWQARTAPACAGTAPARVLLQAEQMQPLRGRTFRPGWPAESRLFSFLTHRKPTFGRHPHVMHPSCAASGCRKAGSKRPGDPRIATSRRRRARWSQHRDRLRCSPMCLHHAIRHVHQALELGVCENDSSVRLAQHLVRRRMSIPPQKETGLRRTVMHAPSDSG